MRSQENHYQRFFSLSFYTFCMRIQSVPGSPSTSARTLRYLDQTLRQGEKPQGGELSKLQGADSLLLYRGMLDEPFVYLPNRGLVDFGVSSRQLKSDKRMFWGTTLPKCAIFGAGGALLNSTLGPLGMAVGAAIGAGIAFEGDWRKFHGRAEIKVDGEVKDRRGFYLRAADFQLKPEELHLRLTAQGILGDRIQPQNAPAVQPDPALLSGWKQSQPALKDLAEQRRLVADLGGQSDYGKPALHPVQALQAAELLASGHSVFLISGKTEDRQRSLEIDSKNHERTMIHHEKHQFVERKFDYQLRPLHTPQDLADVPAGQGLPEGMMGVYANESSFTTVVSQRDARQQMEFQKDGHSNQVWEQRKALDPSADLGVAGPNYRVRTLMNVTPLLTMTGALVGGLAGTVLGNQYTLLSMVAGGLAGRQAGRMLTDRL